MTTDQPLQYFLELGGARFPLREVAGREAINEPFRLEVRFALEKARDLDPEALIEKDAVLCLERSSVARTVTGIVTDISVGATRKGAPEVRVVIEPRFVLARFRQDIRLFRDQTAPDIVSVVLGGLGIAHELRLSSSYAVRPYCVQYRETDFAFVNRLLEDEGIFYYFTPGGTMVLGDSPGAYEAIPGGAGMPFRADSGLDRNDDAVAAFGEHAAYGPGKASLRDFNPEHPSLEMDVSASGPTSSGPEYYDFPGEYEQPAEGNRKVGLLAEAFSCRASGYAGRSFSGRLVPGHSFALGGPPSGLTEGEYAVTEVEHRWHRDEGGFAVAFRAVSAGVAWRPTRRTPVPAIPNPHTGFVTGPPGEDIHTDKWGRVKVQFHWDRLWPRDDTCSHWIPVLQDNTGQSCSIPRVGWEVLVHFLEGDPDRPVVVGRVYNPNDPPHIELPVHKTRSSIRSLSSPREKARDDSGYNEIFIEDRAGFELLQFQAEKDQNVVVANDKNETILVNQTSSVERDERITIGNDHTVSVDSQEKMVVKGNQSWSVAGNRSVSVDGELATNVGGNRSVSIGGMHMRRIANSDTTTVDKSLTETVGGIILEASLKSNDAEGTRAGVLLVGGAHIEIAKQDKTEAVGLARAELVGGAVFVKAGGEMGTRAGKQRATTVGGMFQATSVKEMSLVAVDEISMLCGKGAFDGADGITFKVGDTMLVMKEGIIGLDAKTEIKLIISGTNTQGTDEAFQN